MGQYFGLLWISSLLRWLGLNGLYAKKLHWQLSKSLSVGFLNNMNIKEQVLLFLTENKNNRYSPTEIGLAIGKEYNSASSSVSGSLRKLEKEGLINICKVGRVVTVKFKNHD